MFYLAAHQKVKSGQELKVEAWRQEQSRGHRGLLLYWLSPNALSVCFVMQLRTTCWGESCHSRLVSPMSFINEKIPQICPQANLMEVFSQLKFFFPDDISLCLADKKPRAQHFSSQLLWDSGVLLGTHKPLFLLSWDTGSVNSLWVCQFLINKEPLRSETTAVFLDEYIHGQVFPGKETIETTVS